MRRIENMASINCAVRVHNLLSYNIDNRYQNATSNLLQLLSALLLIHVLPIHPLNRRHPLLHRFRVGTNNAAVPSHFRLLMFNVR